MSTRTVYLLVYPGARNQRAHFGIWIPSEEGSELGTVIHVVGSPMTGFALVFKRGYNPAASGRATNLVEIGSILEEHLHQSNGEFGEDDIPRDHLEQAATQIQPPRVSANFLAPVNDTTNRRCQEWTMEYVRRLVALGYLDEAAIDIVQSKRDPPDHGIGLRPATVRPH